MWIPIAFVSSFLKTDNEGQSLSQIVKFFNNAGHVLIAHTLSRTTVTFNHILSIIRFYPFCKSEGIDIKLQYFPKAFRLKSLLERPLRELIEVVTNRLTVKINDYLLWSLSLRDMKGMDR